MDGLINLYKPTGLSSTEALHRVRRITGQRKSGHGGTLDPLAEGVLVLCLGRATKLVEALMDQPKTYRTTAALDRASETFDYESPTNPVPVTEPPNLERIRDVLRTFEGINPQVPPASSAVKVSGRPAYRLARSGQPPILLPRPVRIYWIHLHRYEWPLLDIELTCGRGTYVRALIRDIGERLGTGGCLTRLVRTAVGPVRIEESWTLERIQAAAEPAAYLVPTQQARELLAERPIRVPPRPG
jgi:tRNA pseudouridine55 synthase